MVAGEARGRARSRVRSLVSTGGSGALRERGNVGSVVRRLLAIGGLAAAGWLLGSTGQAHAETVIPQHAVAGVPARSSAEPARRAARPTSTPPIISATPASPAHLIGGDSAGGAASVETRPGALCNGAGVPGRPLQAVRLERVTGAQVVRRGRGARPDVGGLCALTVRHRKLPVGPSPILSAKAGGTASKGRTAGVSWARRHQAGRAADRSAALVGRSGASKMKVRGGQAVSRTFCSSQAPGLPRPGGSAAGSLPASSGSAPSGAAAAGRLIRAGLVHRPAPLVFTPVPGAVPPAVRTAADEPSFSPD